jgi:hypothetical protein
MTFADHSHLGDRARSSQPEFNSNYPYHETIILGRYIWSHLGLYLQQRFADF